MTTATTATVANEILRQLGGYGKVSAMTGATTFMSNGAAEGPTATQYGRGMGALSFKFKNRKGANWVQITLETDDTYTVEFARLVKYSKRNEQVFRNVYAGDLVELFESTTGLYLSL